VTITEALKRGSTEGKRPELVLEELTGKIIAAAIEVHRQLGPGFLETIYEQSLKIELSKRGIAFEAQKPVEVRYAGELVGNHTLDVMIEGKVVVELKAVKDLDDVHYAQLRSYLRATGSKVGLLMNFNSPTLVVKRVVN
jgi:GxxExxY protein